MGGSTTQPMGAGASSPMGGAQAPMGQGAPQGQQEAQQRYDMAGGQGGQGAPQNMSQFPQGGAGKGAVNPGAPGNYPPPPGYGPGQGSMPDMMGQGAPQNIPQFLQKNGPAMGALPPFNAQSLMLNELGGQGNIPIQAGARAPVAFGAPNPMGAPMLAEQVKAPPPKVQAPEDYYQSFINQNPNFMNGGMNGFKDGGATHPQDTHTVIQNALRLLSNRN